MLIRALEPLEGVEQMLEHRVLRKGALGPAPTALLVHDMCIYGFT